MRNIREITCVLALGVLAAGCHQGMWNKSRFKPYEPTPFFDNHSSARVLPAGVVVFGEPRIDSHLYTGKVDGVFTSTYPFEITEEVLARGKERYEIYCTPCHGYTGDGNGMVVQREMKKAASHTGDPRLLDPVQSPPGYFFDVITNGFGVMYSYATRIKPEDRWAIVAYIKALQISQNSQVAQLSATGKILVTLTPEEQETFEHLSPEQQAEFPNLTEEAQHELLHPVSEEGGHGSEEH